MTVSNEDVACGVPCDIGRTIECIARATRARGSATTATRTTASSRAAATAARAIRWRRLNDANVDRFGFAAHHHKNATLRAELHNLTRRFVNGPDIVLCIDAHAMG